MNTISASGAGQSGLVRKAPNPATLPPLDQHEERELDQWVKRHQPELGLLKSPPIGSAGPKAREAQRYVDSLARDLAGQRLKSEDLDLRIEIFSGDIAQAGLDDSDKQQKAWEAEHPEKPWPIRSWLEAPKDGSKPLYRLAVSQGLLETLETREELGFVVAHQLHRLLEHHAQDPTNEKELKIPNQSWVESREFQLQNDAAALEMMTQANLNPKGALGALDKLYRKFGPNYPKDDQKAALAAATQIQEHEGIRVSALQLQVETLRRSGHPSASQPTQAIPAEVVAGATGDYQQDLPNFGAFQTALNRLSSELATDETPDWMFSDRSKPPALELLKGLQPNPQEFEKALLGTLDHLTQSNSSPQQRVNGFLRLALALEGDCLPEEFSSAGQEKLRAFFEDNGTWSAEAFSNSLGQGERSLHRNFVQQVALNPTFQEVVAPLYGQANSPGLTHLIDGVPAAYCQGPHSNAFEIQALPGFLAQNHSNPSPVMALLTRNFEEKETPSALKAVYNQATLRLIEAQDPKSLAQNLTDIGLPEGLILGNAMRRLDNLDPNFALDLRQSMAPIEQASHSVREDNASLRLRPPLGEPAKLGAYLQEFFASETGGDFSPEFEQNLPPLLRDLIRTCNSQPDLVFDTGRPRDLDPGLERRLTDMLKVGSADDQGQVLKFISRTWPHELRMPTLGERREWTSELASTLAKSDRSELVQALTSQDISQHADFLRQTLIAGYGLADSALPDAETPSLQALEKRVSAGEFKPKRENYSDPAEYRKAREAYDARVESMQGVTQFLAPAESRLVLSKLAILGHDLQASQQVAQKLTGSEFLQILRNTEEVVERSKTVRKLAGDPGLELVGTDAGSFLLDGFLATEKDFASIDEFYDTARATISLSPAAIESRADTRGRLADALHSRLEKLEPKELRDWLGRDQVLSTLKPEQASGLLLSLVGQLPKPGEPVAELGRSVQELDETYNLQDKHGLTYLLLRDTITEKAKLQPGNLDQVFPPSEKNPVEQLQQFRPQLAGLSGLIAMTRNHPPKVQLSALEYLMGRQEAMPEFLEKASENQNLGPVAQTLRNARQQLSESDIALRVIVANSFLAGPNGLLQAEGGREAVLEHFLAGVPPQALKLARPISQAVLTSQGDADSLAVAVVLGQKPKGEGEAALTEADILSRVFDSYGAPGVKMKQYLAFTSQFEKYREAFEDSQDAANPLTYFETLRLIQNRFGDEWPDDLEIDRVLGSGSVNVAIRYKNTTTGKREVVSLGRQDIVEQTEYDFGRFHRFIDALLATDEGKQNFGFIKGLTGIIAESVELEFDKENAKAVQKQAFELYKHTFPDGWTVRSIDAYEVKNLGLFMEEAQGKTARRILNEKPELYQQAMRHMAKAEVGLLRGRDSTGNLRPRPNFANPDIHDGQVLIDEANKTATVLDFGQAVPISNKERQLGLDLLLVLGKLSTAKGAAKRLNKKFLPGVPKGEGFTKEEVRSLWKTPKKMDTFIRMLSMISEKGGHVPLSTVHWVLALNRMLVLGDKLDQSIKGQMVGMVVNHRLGLGLGVFNTVHAASEKVAQWGSSLASGIAGLVTSWCRKEVEPEPVDQVSAASNPLFKSFVPTPTEAQTAEKPKVETSSSVTELWRKPSSYAFYLDDLDPDYDPDEAGRG